MCTHDNLEPVGQPHVNKVECFFLFYFGIIQTTLQLSKCKESSA